MGAGFSSSEREARQKKYEQDMELWKETIVQIEEYEREQWRRVTPGPCRLAAYWVQMLLCMVECAPRFAFHALAWLLVLPFWTLEQLLFACCACCEDRPAPQPSSPSAAAGSSSPSTTTAVAKREPGKARESCWNGPGPASNQLNHHSFWATMYAVHFPRLLSYNLLNPVQPFFADGVDITVYRPEEPQPPPADICEACCLPMCRNCTLCFQTCGSTLEAISIRYFRSSFIVLSGYHALQCGSCLGPCVRPLCYDPCVGRDIESGRCAMCEVDAIRVARWAREAHEAKVARSTAFYSQHPKLMRPPDQFLAILPNNPPKAASPITTSGVVLGVAAE